VLEYLTNYVRILDQTDNLHPETASWADQGINLSDLFDNCSRVQRFRVQRFRVNRKSEPLIREFWFFVPLW
jgi:hypothetical protein